MKNLTMIEQIIISVCVLFVVFTIVNMFTLGNYNHETKEFYNLLFSSKTAEYVIFFNIGCFFVSCMIGICAFIVRENNK